MSKYYLCSSGEIKLPARLAETQW